MGSTHAPYLSPTLAGVSLDTYDETVRRAVTIAFRQAATGNGWPESMTEDLVRLIEAAQQLARALVAHGTADELREA